MQFSDLIIFKNDDTKKPTGEFHGIKYNKELTNNEGKNRQKDTSEGRLVRHR